MNTYPAKVIVRAVGPVGAAILLGMILEFSQTGQVKFHLDELEIYCGKEDDQVRKALKVMESMNFVTIHPVNGEKLVSLALPEFQLRLNMPAVALTQNRDSENSESLLSSSSNLINLSTELITTTTTKVESENSESQKETGDDDPKNEQVDMTAQVKRILDATHLVFGEPGVFTKGLVLESLYPEVVLGWIRQAYNAKNLLPDKQAGTVYNGLRSGDKPKHKFMYDPDSVKLPHDFLVAIGDAKKECPLCGDEFDDLDAYDEHWKICVRTAKPEPEPADVVVAEVAPIQDEAIMRIWDDVLLKLRQDMPRASFETWVRDAIPVAWEDHILTVVARNSYACDWLAGKMQGTIDALLTDALGADAIGANISVRFVTA